MAAGAVQRTPGHAVVLGDVDTAWSGSDPRAFRAGAVRDGGSFYDRMGKVACWNAVMDEDRYMVRKWNEFVAA